MFTEIVLKQSMYIVQVVFTLGFHGGIWQQSPLSIADVMLFSFTGKKQK